MTSTQNTSVATIGRVSLSRTMIIVLLALATLAFSFNFLLSIGFVDANILDFFTEMSSGEELSNRAFVVYELRLPRAIIGILVGAALGVAGAITQTITRNPLGDPSLTGVTSGAAFFVVAGFLYFNPSLPTLILLGVFGGTFGASITFLLARASNYSPIHIVLAGMAVFMFFSAAITALNILNSANSNSTFYWLVGNLANRGWTEVSYVWLPIILIILASWSVASVLNILMFDDDTARSRGLATGPWRLGFGMGAVVLTACCVAVAGPISFIGLVAPHIVRMGLGSGGVRQDSRVVIPLSALVGAAILSVTDVVAVSGIIGAVIPTGILCIFIGGVMFTILFKQGKI